MRLLSLVAWGLALAGSQAAAQYPAHHGSCGPVNATTRGLSELVKRRMPRHADLFTFELVDEIKPKKSDDGVTTYDAYTVSTHENGCISVQGTTLSALSTGLHDYMKNHVHRDLNWFVGSRLHQAPPTLPQLDEPLCGASVVPWRYHFNTVTFSYTTAFYSWEDWELELDWMALRGINLPLAWNGQEKLLLEAFREVNLTDSEIIPYFSGPAFQSWQRFGNIQGSWGGQLPMDWIDSQFELQKRIVKRMSDLGMTPVLPAFTGFVPNAFWNAFPDAQLVNGSQWEGFESTYTNVTFLSPQDELFGQIQTSFLEKQMEAYSNVTHIWTLDQYNENSPPSGDLDYLSNLTYNTWKTLKAADPEAVWLMQGWLFYSDSDFWTEDRIEAYLGGVPEDKDMLILDLFSESEPQWQRTKSYFGKPWIWCQLHDYGGNMGLYGQVENVTISPLQALAESPSLIGFGLTPEGQEGNEIIYELLLSQAWSSQPIDTATYFQDWVTTRYSTPGIPLPQGVYEAWDLLRTTVYNNTNLTVPSVPKSILELEPSISGLTDRTGHHPTILPYDPSSVVSAWQALYSAAAECPRLWSVPAYQYDLVDLTRQMLSNHFLAIYEDMVRAWLPSPELSSSTSSSSSMFALHKNSLRRTLAALDSVLSTNAQFSLDTWVSDARALAEDDERQADFYEYNARNQVTLWGPRGQISDYASKSWAGLVGGYYRPRWEIFMEYLSDASPNEYDGDILHGRLMAFEMDWQKNGGQMRRPPPSSKEKGLKRVLAEFVRDNWSVEGILDL